MKFNIAALTTWNQNAAYSGSTWVCLRLTTEELNLLISSLHIMNIETLCDKKPFGGTNPMIVIITDTYSEYPYVMITDASAEDYEVISNDI
jgi:hypothetical protein